MMFPTKSSLVFENHKSLYGLDAMLYRPMVNNRPSYFRSGGLGELIRRTRAGNEPTRWEMEWMAERYIGERLMYYPIGADLGPEQLNYHLENKAGELLRMMEKKVHTVWMDLQANQSTNRVMLGVADRVIICLPQNRECWESLFRNHKEVHRKAFYLIGNYEDKSELTQERLCREYGVAPVRISVIPHCTSLMDAVSKGVMIPYLMRVFHSEKGDILYPMSCWLRDMMQKMVVWLGEGEPGEEKHGYEYVAKPVCAAYVADHSDGVYDGCSGQRCIDPGRCG